MTGLVQLYPRAWRDRYEVEFQELLVARPPGRRDRWDILLGAVDARLHPEETAPTGDTSSSASIARTRRLCGLAMVAAGVLWISAGIMLVREPLDAYGQHESLSFQLVALVAGLLLGGAMIASADVLGDVARLTRRLGFASIVGAGLAPLPWPIVVIGLYTMFGASLVLGVHLGRHGAPVLGIALAVTSAIAFSLNTGGDIRPMLTIPLGLAWIVVGAALAVGRVRPTADHVGG